MITIGGLRFSIKAPEFSRLSNNVLVLLLLLVLLLPRVLNESSHCIKNSTEKERERSVEKCHKFVETYDIYSFQRAVFKLVKIKFSLGVFIYLISLSNSKSQYNRD